jgi:hypothetical protein
MQAITTIGFDIAKSVGLPAIALAGFREMWSFTKFTSTVTGGLCCCLD